MINTNSNLTPFQAYCQKVLPAVYDDSLSYYELLAKLTDSLNNTIAQTNINGSAITELQNYVTNYFTNLDVQSEINNKLDAMASSGELQAIIGEFLKLNSLMTFNTVADMKASKNIINGTSVQTLGYTSMNDGKGHIYKIRNVVTGDVVDNDNIIAINYTLVAQKINFTVGRKFIIIGDSYLAGQGLTTPATQNFGYLLMTKMGIPTSNYYIWGEGGASFISPGSFNHTFQQLIEANKSLVTPTDITDILVLGGYNDVNAANSTQIESAIANFMVSVGTNYPNAKVYLGLIGNNSQISSNGNLARSKVKGYIYSAWNNAYKYGAFVIPFSQLPMQDYNNFGDSVHPNATGHIEIANFIYQQLNFGNIEWLRGGTAISASPIPSATGTIGTAGFTYIEKLITKSVEFSVYFAINLATPLGIGHQLIDLGEQTDLHFMRNISSDVYSMASEVNFLYGTSGASSYSIPCRFLISSDNHLKIRLSNNVSNIISLYTPQWTTFKFDYKKV